MPPADGPRVSLVVAMRDEAPVLGEFLRRAAAALEGVPGGFEMVAVDDGSTDRTWRMLLEASSSRPWLRGARLARSFGQHPATIAGLETAGGEVLVTMDADLQVFPEDIPLLLGGIDSGADLVFAARRHEGEGALRARVGQAVHDFLARHALGKPPTSVSTFLAARREVVDGALSVRRRRPVVPFHLMLGRPVRVESVDARSAPRPGGKSKYGLWKLARLSWDVMASYTRLAPLVIVTAAGAASLLGIASVVAGLRFSGGLEPVAGGPGASVASETVSALARAGLFSAAGLAAAATILCVAWLRQAVFPGRRPIYEIAETF